MLKIISVSDPKHTSLKAREFYREMNINWWKTPAESPDCNPIENLWAHMKAYLRRHVKPRTLQQLVAGCKKYWRTVDVDRCNKFIDHLHKVIPEVIRREGQGTIY